MSDKPIREWWIDPTPDNGEELEDEIETAVFIAMEKHPQQGPLGWQANLIRVLEAAPALARIKELEKELNRMSEIAHDYGDEITRLKAQLEKRKEQVHKIINTYDTSTISYGEHEEIIKELDAEIEAIK